MAGVDSSPDIEAEVGLPASLPTTASAASKPEFSRQNFWGGISGAAADRGSQVEAVGRRKVLIIDGKGLL